MSLKECTKELKGKNDDGELVKTIFISLVVSFLILGVLYYFKLRYITDFLPKYGLYLFFAVLSYAVVLPAVRQVRSFKQFPCMSGMMIGMTIGMIVGFLA